MTHQPTKASRERHGGLVRRAILVLGLVALLMPAGAPPAMAAGLGLALVELGLSQPVFVTHAGDARLFVVEQGGLIKIVGGGTFLDLSGLISQGSERGLLGLAFHPDYASNGRFYVNYTRASNGATVVAEYRRSAGNPDQADAGSARTVLTIDQPASNHNGGWLGFKGANLYIATGDGGGLPGTRAQSLTSLLGKILRINPLDPDGNGPKTYSIPGGNPYVGRSGSDEIFARGLRNPWRCSFDRLTRRLWCADVGQGAWEEINRSRTGRGLNYGWQLLEGRHRYPSGDACTSKCRTLPIAEYSHAANGGPCSSVTGGYVSRRPGAVLHGQYIFGDYCSGKVWIIPAGFGAGSALPAPVADTAHSISSFGEDNVGRLYLVDRGGVIYRLTDS